MYFIFLSSLLHRTEFAFQTYLIWQDVKQHETTTEKQTKIKKSVRVHIISSL